MTVVVHSWSDRVPMAPRAAAQRISTSANLQVTSVLFAVYLLSHCAYLLNHGLASWFSPAYAAVALGLLMAPHITWLFALGAGASLADALTHLPMQSNHTLMSMIFCLGVVYAYLHQAISLPRVQPDASLLFDGFAPLGRWLLLGMYFYGVFHKVNADFVNAEVNCAVVLLRAFELPLHLDNWPVAQYAWIYGTLVVETRAILCLLTSRFRYYGLLIGVAFHWMIGFNGYADYIAFSLISIVMHSLFLPRDIGDRINKSPFFRALSENIGSPPSRVALVGLVVILSLLIGRNAAWVVFGVAILAFVAVFARASAVPVPITDDLRPSSFVIGALSALFLVNGMLPFLGLKTGQTISMFSNLTTEGGESNHLLMVRVPQIFGYQASLAEIVDSEDPLYLADHHRGYRFVEWSVLDRFERTGLTTTYRVNGVETHLSQEDRDRVAATLPPRFLRSFFVFKPVNMARPRTCDLY